MPHDTLYDKKKQFLRFRLFYIYLTMFLTIHVQWMSILVKFDFGYFPFYKVEWGYTVLPLSVRPFKDIFLSKYRWQKSDIWSQASYTCRYPISWEAFFDPSDSYFLFADFLDFYTHLTYIHIFLSNCWWQAELQIIFKSKR
jgi:hypothetical protein